MPTACSARSTTAPWEFRGRPSTRSGAGRPRRSGGPSRPGWRRIPTGLARWPRLPARAGHSGCATRGPSLRSSAAGSAGMPGATRGGWRGLRRRAAAGPRSRGERGAADASPGRRVGRGRPGVDAGFYEFVPEEAMDARRSRRSCSRTSWRWGAATASSFPATNGLYRYDLNDIVRGPRASSPDAPGGLRPEGPGHDEHHRGEAPPQSRAGRRFGRPRPRRGSRSGSSA